MRYMLLIYGSESHWQSQTEEERQAILQGYRNFYVEGQKRGVVEDGSELHDITMATSVRIRDGKALITDGPFAETKEQLGGYFLLNCANLDEAIEMAQLIPGAKTGTIEIRPIVEQPVQA